jgi:hypothetical protein
MTPVKWCDYLLRLILTRDQVDLFTDDLHEEYADMLADYGRNRADIWYITQAARSAWPLLSARTRARIQAFLSGAVLAAEEITRRHIK